jgi:hypothetical protein
MPNSGGCARQTSTSGANSLTDVFEISTKVLAGIPVFLCSIFHLFGSIHIDDDSRNPCGN